MTKYFSGEEFLTDKLTFWLEIGTIKICLYCKGRSRTTSETQEILVLNMMVLRVNSGIVLL